MRGRRFSVTSTVIVVFDLTLVFNHWTRRPQSEHAVTVAVRAGASAAPLPTKARPDRPALTGTALLRTDAKTRSIQD